MPHSFTIPVLCRASTQQKRAPDNLARENPVDVCVGAHADQDFMCLRSLSCSDLVNHVLVEYGYHHATFLLHLCHRHPACYSSHLTISNTSYWVVSSTEDILLQSFLSVPVLLSASRNQALSSHRLHSLVHKILLASTYALWISYGLTLSSVNTSKP